MRYQVLENNVPADHHHNPHLHPSWNNSLFDTYVAALNYLQRYMGEYAGTLSDNFPTNIPYDYSGYGDTVEIREVE